MTKEDMKKLEDRKLTVSMVISCLATCEKIISKCAYDEKKWMNSKFGSADEHRNKRIEWMEYRTKLRSVLLPLLPMKNIIQQTKSCTEVVSQRNVKDVVMLIETGDYTLV